MLRRWFSFTTSEQSVLKQIVSDDVTTSTDYEQYLDECAAIDQPITVMHKGEEITISPMDGDDWQKEVMRTLERKVIGQQVLDKLKKGGEEHD